MAHNVHCGKCALFVVLSQSKVRPFVSVAGCQLSKYSSSYSLKLTFPIAVSLPFHCRFIAVSLPFRCRIPMSAYHPFWTRTLPWMFFLDFFLGLFALAAPPL
jgi:hypothetical protein